MINARPDAALIERVGPKLQQLGLHGHRCGQSFQAALEAYRNHRGITRHPSWFQFRTSDSKHLKR